MKTTAEERAKWRGELQLGGDGVRQARINFLIDDIDELLAERDYYQKQFTDLACNVRAILNKMGWSDEFIKRLYELGVQRGLAEVPRSLPVEGGK